jgi:hypothetical protein
MMKTNIAILLFSLIPSGLFGQGVSWIRTMGGAGADNLLNSCTDSIGNLYVCGVFGHGASSAFFGDEVLTTPGVNSAFVTKLDSNGDFLWARRAGGTFSSPEDGFNNGVNVYYDTFTDRLFLLSVLSGHSQVIGSCTPDGTGSYLSSFDTNGNCIWTTSHMNCRTGYLQSDGSGFIYSLVRAGAGGGVLNGEPIAEGWHIAKLDSWDGTTVWSSRIADLDVSLIRNVFKDGSLYFTGHLLAENWQWDTVQLNNYPFDIALAKYDGNGALQWVRTYGGPGVEGGGYIDMDDAGNIYMFGTHSDSAHFGSDILLLNDNDDRNLFLAKLDSEGEPEWVSTVPVQGSVFTKDLGMTAGGDLLCVAHLNGSLGLDGAVLSSKSKDAVMLRFDSEGNFISSLSFEIGNNANLSYVEPVSPDKTYLISGYSGETSIQGIPVSGFGSRDVLVARLDLTTGVPEARLSNELHIYANPSAGKCNITVPDEFGNEPRLQLRIMDMEGRLVSEQLLDMGTGRITLNLESEAKGVYNISLSNGVKQYFGRAVFE